MKIQGKVKVRRVSLLTHTGLRFSSVFLFIFGRKRVWDSLSCSAVPGFPCVP